MLSNRLEMLLLGAHLWTRHPVVGQNRQARAVTRWMTACDRRWARWISYIHSTIYYKQKSIIVMWKILYSIADWDCARIPDFAGDPEDAKSTSERRERQTLTTRDGSDSCELKEETKLLKASVQSGLRSPLGS